MCETVGHHALGAAENLIAPAVASFEVALARVAEELRRLRAGLLLLVVMKNSEGLVVGEKLGATLSRGSTETWPSEGRCRRGTGGTG
jgi:hypothetical protein